MTHTHQYEELGPGYYYHIYNRGNNRENLFNEEKNYFYFLNLLKKHILPIADLYAYCLMKNHFHFLVKIKLPDEVERDDEKSERFLKPVRFEQTVSRSFSNFFNAYAKAINKEYSRTGSLFQERFRRKRIDKDSYFTEIIFYIHGNPQRHGFVDDFRKYKHSSYQRLLSEQPTRLKRDEVLTWFGGKEAFMEYHEGYRNALLDYKYFLEKFSDDD